MARLRVGVLISGRGSNLAALIRAATDPAYPAEIALVISNRAEAPGLLHAEHSGIPHRTITSAERVRFAAEADAALREARVELVALAGFMRILDTGFVEGWRDRMVNIHPSLLPTFPGLHAQRQALAVGVKVSGCTVHFVRAEVDTGPIIAQAAVPVYPGDDEDRLAERILAAEHRLYPSVVRLIAEGRVRVRANTVEIAGLAPAEAVLFNPPTALASTGG